MLSQMYQGIQTAVGRHARSSARKAARDDLETQRVTVILGSGTRKFEREIAPDSVRVHGRTRSGQHGFHLGRAVEHQHVQYRETGMEHGIRLGIWAQIRFNERQLDAGGREVPSS